MEEMFSESYSGGNRVRKGKSDVERLFKQFGVLDFRGLIKLGREHAPGVACRVE